MADADKLAAWLAGGLAQYERDPQRVRAELLERCRAERIEPPTAKRLDRIVRAGLHAGEQALIRRVTHRLDQDTRQRLTELIALDDNTGDDEDGAESGELPLLARIKQAPGNVSLETMLIEIDKLEAVRAIGLPEGLLADIAPRRVVSGWRSRAAVESPVTSAVAPGTGSLDTAGGPAA